MAPNSTSTSVSNIDNGLEHLSDSKASLLRTGPKGQPASTYPGIWKYPTNRDDPTRSAQDWLRSKKIDDDIGNLWRVFDKLYDLSPFIQNHPGGPEWLSMTQGTDITEQFIVSHVINTKTVEKILASYYVKDADSPRIAPFTFKPEGFYMTLKRRVEPIFKEIGTGPTFTLLAMQDALVLTFLLFGILGAMWNNLWMALLSGFFLSCSTIGAHNFLHLRENWRRYYFDLSFNCSFDFRITHAMSHHMFPNTLMDIELILYPTFQFLPNLPKHWIQRHFSMFYSHITYALGHWLELIKRFYHVLIIKEKSFRPENSLPFLVLLLFISVSEEASTGLWVWAVMHTACSFTLLTIGATASHHHTTCFVDGDEPLADPDFGIGQLDATKDRAENFFNNLFVTLVTFGHHPLHHMFPTVCHSKLPFVKEIFEQTVRDFNIDFPGIPQSELYVTCYQELARTQPNKRVTNKKLE